MFGRKILNLVLENRVQTGVIQFRTGSGGRFFWKWFWKLFHELWCVSWPVEWLSASKETLHL